MSDCLDDTETLQSILRVIPELPSNIDNAGDRSNAAPSTQKLKKFVYLSKYDELLAKCVCEHHAHKVGYGKKIKAFKTVRSFFVKSIRQRTFVTHNMPNVKSFRDCYIHSEKYRLYTV